MSRPFHLFLTLCILASPSGALAQETKKDPPDDRFDLYGDPLPKGAIARLGTGRLCRAGIQFLAFTPDSMKLVTVADEGKVQVWDINSGQELRHWNVARHFSYAPHWSPLVFSHDGRWVALACYDKTLRVWEMDTGQEIMSQPQGFGGSVSFSPDKKAIAALSGNTVRVYDPVAGALLHEFQGCKFMNHVAFSADGKAVVAVGHEQPDRKVFIIQRWDATTGKEQPRHSVGFYSVYATRLSPDGRFFAIPETDRTAIRCWDTATGKELPSTAGKISYPAQLAFAADGKTFTSIGRDGRLRVWESATGKTLHDFASQAGDAQRVALSADGKLLAATTSKDQGIHIWNVATGKERHEFGGHRNGPLTATFAPDGKSVLTVSRDSSFSHPSRAGMDWSLRRWDFRTGKELQVWKEDQKEVRHAFFSPNGQFATITNSSGTLRLFNSSDGKAGMTWKLPTRVITHIAGTVKEQFDSLFVEFLGFSPDGATIAGATQGKLTLWERETGKTIREITRPELSYPRFAFFPDGKWILIADWSGGLYALTVVDAKTGTDVRKFPNIRDVANALAVAPDGRSVAKISSTNLTLYEMLTLEERSSVNLGAWSFALAYSPDGRLLVSGGRDAVVRLWDATSGRAIQQLSSHGGEINSLAFSRDGRWLVSTAENTALVWDVEAILRESKFVAANLAEAEMDRLWRDLAATNASQSAAALSRLSQGGENAVAFLLKQLTKPPAVNTDNIDKLLIDLGNDQFAVRENAMRDLRKIGYLAAPALKQALEKPLAVEPKRRMKILLSELSVPPPAWLQANRGLEVLERIGNRPARTAFVTLAKQAPESWMRLEARQALQRLERGAMP